MAERFERLIVQEPNYTPSPLHNTVPQKENKQALVSDEGFLSDPVLEIPGYEREWLVEHMPGMIAQRGQNFFQIRKLADRTHRLKHIITADSPKPKEIDDGVFVEELPSATEMYRVGVCLPDTSRLYLRQDVLEPALDKLHADYWVGDDGELDYSPLIEERFIRGYEMSQGNRRNALIVSFIVGQNHPPSDASVSFEKVFIDRNFDYREFSEHTRPSGQYERYARAGHYILEQLQYADSADTAAITQADTLDMVRHLIKQQPDRLHIAGPSLTAAYMIATNHIGGLLLQDAERVGINRIYDPGNMAPHDFLPADVARFSTMPGPHVGLGLSNVLQITSPLRRLQDGLNGIQLWKLARGMRQDRGDVALLEDATQLLNFEIVKKQISRVKRRRHIGMTIKEVQEAVHEEALEVMDSMTA
ncbi:hypothetical protein H7097_01915 [Aeromicrobium sp.]|nr:hypothetical protein [Candidatus Saccharibacteria bacterium]